MSILKRHHLGNSKGKILVSAQTNANVDKLCERALSVFPPVGGRNLVVRTGDDGRFHESVRSVSVNRLAREHVADGLTKATLESQAGGLLESFLTEEISETDFVRAVDSLAAQLRDLKRQRAAEEQWRVEILKRASFVFCTLGSAGAELLDKCSFSLVIVHGANSAREASTLIPFRHVDRAVLFGDQHQLQPIVADVGKWIGYNSLFERLVRGGHPLFGLNTQALYHPSIYKADLTRSVLRSSGRQHKPRFQASLPLAVDQPRLVPQHHSQCVRGGGGSEDVVRQ